MVDDPVIVRVIIFAHFMLVTAQSYTVKNRWRYLRSSFYGNKGCKDKGCCVHICVGEALHCINQGFPTFP